MEKEQQAVSRGELRQQLEKILDEEGRQTPERLRRAAWLLESIADAMESAGEVGERDGKSTSVYGIYAVEYIQSHFREKIRISELAEHIGVSRGYLVRLIEEEVGMSPQEYLTCVRMGYARQCLEKTDDLIRDVGIECGYEDPLAFSKAFKRKFGVSPSEYRRECREREYFSGSPDSVPHLT